jgi:tetratricopeptide (TPR) repeat protein
VSGERPSSLREAERLTRQGALRQAVQAYVQALEQDPNDIEATRAIVELCERLDEPGEALPLLVRTADGLREAGELEKAAALYEQVLAIGTVQATTCVAGSTPRPEPAPAFTAAPDLEDVFAGFRREVESTSREENADARLLVGETILATGCVDEALAALTAAAEAPRLRFRAASLAARTYRARGDARKAVEWFERALEAPAPTSDAAHAVLYDLADALEGMGEEARALANFLEVRSAAGDYRDVSVRIRRLDATRTRG